MTPYELRFAILKAAIGLVQDEYHAALASREILITNNPTVELPKFPSYEKIEKLADQMNKFVSNCNSH